MREGDAPWLVSQPAGTRFLPFNPATGRNYSGINALALLMAARDRGYVDPRWLTRDQAHAIGAAVRLGETGTVLQYWRWSEERPVPGPDGRPLMQRVALERPRLQAAMVFNAGQIDGLPPLTPRPVMPAAERHAAAEAMIATSTIRHEYLPEREQFSDIDDYYAAVFHALVRHEWRNIATNTQYMHPLGSK
jgi:putative DNA primase/helicase